MKITIWDILSFLVILVLFAIGALVLMVYNDPYAAVNPFPPPTLPAKLNLPTWTTTPQSMPPTWTTTPVAGVGYTLAPTSTPMPSATRGILFPVIRPTRTFTASPLPPTNTLAASRTPARSATSGNTPTRTRTNTPGGPTATRTYTPTFTFTPTASLTPSFTPTPTYTSTATDTPVPQPTSIAFSVDYNGDGIKDIVTMSSNGEYATMIRAGSPGAEPIVTDWSPDGNWLLFHIGNIPEVKRIRPDGSDEGFLSIGFASRDAVYSPTGSEILYAKGNGSSAELWRGNSSGALTPQRLTTDSYADESPDWSPDGHSIVYRSRGALYLLDLNTGPTYVITALPNSGGAEAPQFVSDTQIVYMVQSGGQYDIYLADINNMNDAVNLTNTSAENEKYPAWAPGNKILYAKLDGTSGIYVMGMDGSGKTLLNPTYRYAQNPRWIP